MKKLAFIGLSVYCVWVCANFLADSFIKYDKNVYIKSDPIQASIEKDVFTYKGFQVTPVATYDIKARILSKQRYWFDAQAKFAPYDFAVGWGPMSQYEVLKHVKVRQASRWYFYHMKDTFISKKDVGLHSSNMHLIPADKNVKRMMARVRKGEVVHLKGYLVNVTNDQGKYWNTSTGRADRNGGACELMWVEELIRL